MSNELQTLLKYTIFSAPITVWTYNDGEETPENGGGGGLHGILLLFTDYDCAWLGTQYLETDGLMY